VLRSLRTAERAMQLDQLRVEALASNLANVDANGFKQVLTSVRQLPDADGGPGAVGGRAMPADVRARRRNDPLATWPRQAPIILSHATDARQGVLRQTGRSTDVALAGEGFFAVETEAGEFYTRDGSFRRDAQSRLVTATGEPVLGEGGPIRIPGGELVIAEDGSVQVDGQPVGRLRLVTFAEPQRLTHRGGSLLEAPPDLEATDLPPERARVQQGVLEESNVNPIDTLVDMIAAQRSFEVASKVMMANDELLEKSVNQIPRSR
jgi:flagellar basal-body rod protein FlgG